MAAAGLLGSLARKMATHHRPPVARGLHGSASLTQPTTRLVHGRGLDNSPGASPPSSKTDVTTKFAKIQAGVAYVALYGSMAYLYGSLLPRLERMEARLEAARNMLKLDDASAVQALRVLLAVDGPDAQNMRGSGHGKQSAGETGKGTKHEDL